jgi:hypothetical protein
MTDTLTTEPRRNRLVRWAMVVLFVSGLVIGLTVGGAPDRSAFILIPLAVYVCVGNVIAARQPRNPIGWLFLTVGALTGLSGYADAGMHPALTHGTPDVWYGVAGAWIYSWFWYPLIAIATVFTVLLFPDGLPSSRWRPLLWVSVSATSVVTVVAALNPHLDMGNQSSVKVDNPLNPGIGEAAGAVVLTLAGITLLGCGIAAVVCAIVRTRHARGVERQQMRWFAFAALVFLGWVVVSSLFIANDPVWSEVVLAVALGLIPLSCGLAILRYHLYDIDRIISRTTAYALVTGLLIGTFAAIVALGSSVLGPKNQLGVAVATLAAAALARPTLRRVQRIVDRRFDRARYDGQHTVNEFGARLRHEVDAETVGDDLIRVVGSTLHPEQVSLWVRST